MLKKDINDNVILRLTFHGFYGILILEVANQFAAMMEFASSIESPGLAEGDWLMLWIIISFTWMLLSIGILLLLGSRYDALEPLQPRTIDIDRLPTLGVILPVRNEAENILPCIESLIAQDYPSDRLQVIIADDDSQDTTTTIARKLARESKRVAFVEAGQLPEGWLGKPHACWVGATSTRTDWLCFLDADTRHSPNLLSSAVTLAELEEVDLLSLHPQQEMLDFWERLLMPIPFMNLMVLLDATAIRDPKSKQAMANGQFILIRKQVYDSIDGHQAVRDQVLEDVALARLVKAAGHRIRLLGGAGWIRTRMYTDIQSLWHGIARAGSELFGPALTSLAIITSILASFVPLTYPLWRIAQALVSPSYLWILSALFALAGSLVWYGAHALALRKYAVPLTYLLLLPLSYLFIAVINLDGLLRRARGRRIWKGRKL